MGAVVPQMLTWNEGHALRPVRDERKRVWKHVGTTIGGDVENRKRLGEMEPLSSHCWEAVRLIPGAVDAGGGVLTGIVLYEPALCTIDPCVGVQFLPYETPYLAAT